MRRYSIRDQSTTVKMDEDKKDYGITHEHHSDDNIADLKSLDDDAMKLAEMGYTQDMKRNFSVLSVLGVGFSLTNSWFGISAALVTGINSGGPILIIYGIILIALISTCVGITLSELASALPNAGGQYFWASELAPKKYANFASYLTGWFAWAGAIFTSVSVAIAVGAALVGCWQLAHPDLYVPLHPLKSRTDNLQYYSTVARLCCLPGRQYLFLHLQLLRQSAPPGCNGHPLYLVGLFLRHSCGRTCESSHPPTSQIRLCKFRQQYWLETRRYCVHRRFDKHELAVCLLGLCNAYG